MRDETKVFLSSFIFAAGIAAIVGLASPPNTVTSQNSVVRASLESQKSRPSRRLASLMPEAENRKNNFKELVERDIERELKVDQPKLAEKLEVLDKKVKTKLSEMRNKGIRIPRILRIGVRQRVAVSHYIGIDPSTISIHDLESANLSTYEWARITNFSSSNDFEILLRKNRLSEKTIRELAFSK